MRLKLIATTLVSLAFLSACANYGKDYQPVIDDKGVDMSRYQQDLQECQDLSTQTQGVGKDAGKKAIGGAAVGALIGLVAGGNSSNIAQAAGVGGVIGGASGAYSGNQERENVIKRCLAGRGYRVLN